MAGRWRDPAAFRAAPAAIPAIRPSRRQSLTLVAVLALVAGAVTVASYVIRPDRARAFDLVHGSVFLADIRGPVAVDLASAKPTVRISGADDTVGATNADDLAVVPLASGTLLLNSATGEFNMIDSTGFVVKHDGGVPLPQRTGSSSVAVPAGNLAYIEQTGASGTSVYLVTQATVTSALNAHARVEPRASASSKRPGSTAPGLAASADGALWLLLDDGNRKVVEQLSVPAGSSAGAALHRTEHGSVSGPAVLGSAGDAIGLATSSSIEVFTGSHARTVHFPAVGGVDSILPVADQEGSLAYLLHGSTGWSIVSVRADGSGLRGPTLLRGMPTGAPLTEPAQSRGALYTLDEQSGAIYAITGSNVKQVATYPLAEQDGTVVEVGGYSDGNVLARDDRVFVNSPGHREALALFTDGSHPPWRIDKSAGVAVPSSTGAEVYAQTHTTLPDRTGKPGDPTKPSKPTKPISTPPPPQPSTNQLDCKRTTQKPHIPQITSVQAASRSVLLQWTYPLFRDDCEPSTYVVSVRLLSSGAPQPRGTVTVQDRSSVNLGGLYPSSQYELTVTAYIGGQGTSSEAIRITTGKEGPAEPANVRAVADRTGGWTITWDSCGGVQQKCVPATSWNIVPTFCDGLGVEAQLPSLTVPGDPTSRRQSPATYPGSSALLGRGLSFQVEGTGDGTTGAPSASTPCVTSWSPPDASALSLSASQPPTPAFGSTTTTTATLDLGANATRAVGGLGAKITFTLSGPGGTQTRGPITYSGKTSVLHTSFGISAGADYSVSATVTAPGGHDRSVTLGPAQVSTRANWPTALSAVASCPRSGISLSCDLSVQILGISSGAARGERFDLTSDSRLQCGSTTVPITKADFDPALSKITLEHVSQLDALMGSCVVAMHLVEDPSDASPLLFGGTVSPQIVASIDLGAPARAGIGRDDFTVSWDGSGGSSSVHVKYDQGLDDRIAALTKDWSEEVDAPDGTSCGTSNVSSRPSDIAVAPDCVNQYGASSDNWTVQISYVEVSDGHKEGPFVYPLGGPPPSYVPCTPASFDASWGALIADGVTTTYSGQDDSGLAGCSDWQYTLLDPSGTSCGAPDGNPVPPDSAVILLSCDTPPSTGWTVVVTWQDTAGKTQTDNIDVTGDPPTA